MKKFNDKPIEDATEPITVRVMPKDIRNATQRDPSCCAIAQGLLRNKRVESVRIGATTALVEYKDRVVRYTLTAEERKKIRAFDLANYFEPGTYDLIPPKRPIGSRAGTKPGSNVREGNANSVYKTPPLRHV